MVLYNEHNPDDVAIGKVTQDDLRKRPDAVIVAGTTLKVPGVRRIVREMCKSVRDRRGGVAIWINNDLPPVSKDLEECFDIVVQGPSDEVARKAAMRRWDEPSEEDTATELNEEDAAKATAVGVEEVRIPTCALEHADFVRIPSTRHRNNTFRPPSQEPAELREELPSPTDWMSPMTNRRTLVLPSIESAADTIEVKDTGLLTPTKSHKSSPAKKTPPIKLVIKNTVKTKQATLMQPGKPSTSAKSKKSNVKYIKPAKTNGSAKAKAGTKPGAKTKLLTSSWKHTKSVSTVTEKGKAAPKTTGPSPSKLRNVSNASSEPMHPVSPQDPRNNTSPSKKTPFFPGLASASENATQSGKKMLFS
jgi:NAD-dependent histone deacetylase SIR2